MKVSRDNNPFNSNGKQIISSVWRILSCGSNRAIDKNRKKEKYFWTFLILTFVLLIIVFALYHYVLNAYYLKYDDTNGIVVACILFISISIAILISLLVPKL